MPARDSATSIWPYTRSERKRARKHTSTMLRCLADRVADTAWQTLDPPKLLRVSPQLAKPSFAVDPCGIDPGSIQGRSVVDLGLVRGGVLVCLGPAPSSFRGSAFRPRMTCVYWESVLSREATPSISVCGHRRQRCASAGGHRRQRCTSVGGHRRLRCASVGGHMRQRCTIIGGHRRQRWQLTFR